MSGDAWRWRNELTDHLVACGYLRTGSVADAFRTVPRHLFLPGIDPASSYADEAIVTKWAADSQPISSSSQPAIMAAMVEPLDVRPGQRVLEIGAGTGSSLPRALGIWRRGGCRLATPGCRRGVGRRGNSGSPGRRMRMAARGLRGAPARVLLRHLRIPSYRCRADFLVTVPPTERGRRSGPRCRPACVPARTARRRPSSHLRPRPRRHPRPERPTVPQTFRHRSNSPAPGRSRGQRRLDQRAPRSWPG